MAGVYSLGLFLGGLVDAVYTRVRLRIVCYSRNLESNQISGTIPNAIFSPKGLTYLYVGKWLVFIVWDCFLVRLVDTVYTRVRGDGAHVDRGPTLTPSRHYVSAMRVTPGPSALTKSLARSPRRYFRSMY